MNIEDIVKKITPNPCKKCLVQGACRIHKKTLPFGDRPDCNKYGIYSKRVLRYSGWVDDIEVFLLVGGFFLGVIYLGVTLIMGAWYQYKLIFMGV